MPILLEKVNEEDLDLENAVIDEWNTEAIIVEHIKSGYTLLVE